MIPLVDNLGRSAKEQRKRDCKSFIVIIYTVTWGYIIALGKEWTKTVSHIIAGKEFTGLLPLSMLSITVELRQLSELARDKYKW